jgi:hypothetical protein
MDLSDQKCRACRSKKEQRLSGERRAESEKVDHLSGYESTNDEGG